MRKGKEHENNRRIATRNSRPRVGPVEGGLRRSAKVIAHVETDKKPSAISHAECQEMLEWYVQDELTGLNASELYPLVAKHLKACASCKKAYDLFHAALTGPVSQPSPSPAPSGLAFLSPQDKSPWFLEKPSQLLGPDAHLGFWLNPSNLKSLLGAWSVPPAQGHQARELAASWPEPQTVDSELLLVSEETSLGERRIHLRAWMARSASDRWRLSVRAASPDKLGPLAVNLQWDGNEYVQGLVDGRATFENLSLPDFSRYQQDRPVADFRIELRETGSNAG